MADAEWLVTADTTQMPECLIGRASERKLRLFACACCRTSRQLLLRRELFEGVNVAERFADGRATPDELAASSERCNQLAISLYDLVGTTERAARRWAEAVAVTSANHVGDADCGSFDKAGFTTWHILRAAHSNAERRLTGLLLDIFGHLPNAVAADPKWLTTSVVSLATAVYAERAFDRLPILADALEEAGCDHAEMLAHCRSDGQHVLGCWAVDLLIGKN